MSEVLPPELLLLLELNLVHGRRLRQEHVQLALLLLEKFDYLLKAIHNLGEMARLILLGAQRFVSLPGQLIVDCRLRMVRQFEFDALDRFYGLDVHHADPPIRSRSSSVA